jgi:uncharacterized protein (TIGR00266 family)
MRIELSCNSAGRVADIYMESGETFTAEVGAMIAMDPHITVETTSRQAGKSGGILKGLKRMFSGENFFLNHFTAHGSEQRLILGPKLVGDVTQHTLQGGTLVVQGFSWMASSAGIEIDTTWAGISNALFSGEGFFWVKCSGSGDVLINSFGSIYTIEVDGEYIVDTGHVVAYEDTLSFKPTKAGDSWAGSFFGGEGLACRFSGKGLVYCQTHDPRNFGRAVGPKLKPRD